MLVGLAIDAFNGRLTSYGAICSFGARSFIDSMRLHWSELPAMHAGMSVVLLGALPFGVVRTVRCYGLMLVGMEAGPALIQQLAVTRVASTTLVSMMIAGMLLGMAAARAARGNHSLLRRLFFFRGRPPLRPFSRALCRFATEVD